jgi:hypothetical protein
VHGVVSQDVGEVEVGTQGGMGGEQLASDFVHGGLGAAAHGDDFHIETGGGGERLFEFLQRGEVGAASEPAAADESDAEAWARLIERGFVLGGW